MGATWRLIVGGVPSGLDRQVLEELLAPYGAARLDVHESAGGPGESVVVVRIGTDLRLAERLRQRVGGRSIQGHRLWTWLSRRPLH